MKDFLKGGHMKNIKKYNDKFSKSKQPPHYNEGGSKQANEDVEHINPNSDSVINSNFSQPHKK